MLKAEYIVYLCMYIYSINTANHDKFDQLLGLNLDYGTGPRTDKEWIHTLKRISN